METVKFEELQLNDKILRAVTDMGFEAASPIQAQAIPVQMEGKDMIGKDGRLWHPAFGAGVAEEPEDPGHRPLPHEGAGDPGGRRAPAPCKIFARHQGSAGLRRTGDRKADTLLKGRRPDHCRDAGPCHGSYAEKDHPHR